MTKTPSHIHYGLRVFIVTLLFITQLGLLLFRKNHLNPTRPLRLRIPIAIDRSTESAMGRASMCLRSLFTKSTSQINNNSNKMTNNHKPKWITTLLKSCKDINRAGAAVNTNSVVAISSSGKSSSIVCEKSNADEAVANASNTAVDPSRRAAVAIQSVFRGYLARKALRALRALVRLQALVRGYIVRKRAADQVRRMHALIRAQARARAIRAPVPASSYSSSRTSHSCILDPPTPDDFEYTAPAWSSRHDHPVTNQVMQRGNSKTNRKPHPDPIKLGSVRASSRRFDEEKFDKIVEVDSSATKPYKSTSNKNLFVFSDYCSHNAYQTQPMPYQSEDLYLQYSNEIDRYSFYTADDIIPPSHTRSFRSISARRVGGAFAPGDGYSERYLSGQLDHPNYMAYTKSSKAKMRSLSAPRQRTQLDRSTSQKCYSSHEYGSRRLSASGLS